MPDQPQLEEVTVTGDVPIFGDPFAADSFGLTDFLGGLSLNEYAQRQNEAFLSPEPVLLPEVVVTPPPKPVPAPPPIPIRPGVIGAIGAGLTGLAALLFPVATAPPELDEAPTPAGVPPPPKLPPPTLAEPDLPPNWWDISQGGDERLLDPLIPPGLPVPLPEVVVSPPRVVTKPAPTFPDLLPGSGFDLWLMPIGDPFGQPDYSPSPGPGPAPAPDSAPRSDPVPGFPDPFAFPLPDTGVRAAPGPAGEPAPDLFGSPLPDPFGNPFGNPLPAPELPIPTGSPPGASPLPPTTLNPFVTPGDAPDALSDPLLTEFGPSPLKPDSDTCSCAKKPKKKKKSKPRDVCYRGTYRQNSRGITYNRIEEIPCEAKAKTSGRPVPKKRAPGGAPSWQDTINDVFFPTA